MFKHCKWGALVWHILMQHILESGGIRKGVEGFSGFEAFLWQAVDTSDTSRKKLALRTSLSPAMLDCDHPSSKQFST